MNGLSDLNICNEKVPDEDLNSSHKCITNKVCWLMPVNPSNSS